MDYLDLYLIHWPFAVKEGPELFPTGPDGTALFDDTDYLETWKGMEDVAKKGLAKSIGVSNFSKQQLERLLKDCEIPPATNQVLNIHNNKSKRSLFKWLSQLILI